MEIFDRVFDVLINGLFKLIEGICFVIFAILVLFWKGLDLLVRSLAWLLSQAFRLIWAILVFACAMIWPLLRPLFRLASPVTRRLFTMKTLLVVNFALIVIAPALATVQAIMQGQAASAALFGVVTAIVLMVIVRLRRQISDAIKHADDPYNL